MHFFEKFTEITKEIIGYQMDEWYWTTEQKNAAKINRHF